MGENWLDDYRAEKAAYMREYRAARPDARNRERRTVRARSRALTRLAHQYPDDCGSKSSPRTRYDRPLPVDDDIGRGAWTVPSLSGQPKTGPSSRQRIRARLRSQRPLEDTMHRTMPQVVSQVRQRISMQEAAQRMGVSEKTIRRRIRDGKLKAYRHGRLIRIDPADLDALEEPIGPDA